MLETRTRLNGAMPASRRAFSKLTSFSLCRPWPRTRTTRVGTSVPMSLLRLDRLRFLEVDRPGDVVGADRHRMGSLGDGEQPDEGLLPLRIVADAGQVLALDAEVALQHDEVARRARRNGLAADRGQEGVAEVLRIALELIGGVEVDITQRFLADVLDPERDLGDELEPGRPGLVVFQDPGGRVVQDLDRALQLFARHRLAGRQDGERQRGENENARGQSLHGAPPLTIVY